MTSELITTLHERGTHAMRCAEDDTACVETCCSLDTLVRPRFFCGQLLTDHDLMDLARWAQEKHRLGRFRHGWGVVCGLDVRCGAPGEVVVTSGHAVSCCGDDIVVPEPVSFDFTPYCGRERDPCETPYRRRGREASADAEADRGPLFRGGYLQDLAPYDDGGELRVFDLAIRYCERGAEPQEALARDVCSQAGACVDSRTREEYRLAPAAASGDKDPVADAAEAWRRGFEGCLDVLTEFGRRFRAAATEKAQQRAGSKDYGQRVGDWLRSWIADHGLHRFCFLEDRICELRDSGKLADERILELLLLVLVLDCRSRYVTCPCPECPEGHGVPLARVWLRSREDEGGRCYVLAVDAAPPFRRPLAPECWPAPLGYVNAARVIGHRPDEACVTLAGLGLDAEPAEYKVPGDLRRLQDELDCSPFVRCRERAVIRWAGLGSPLGDRVIAVCPRPEDATEGPTDDQKEETGEEGKKTRETRPARQRRRTRTARS